MAHRLSKRQIADRENAARLNRERDSVTEEELAAEDAEWDAVFERNADAIARMVADVARRKAR